MSLDQSNWLCTNHRVLRQGNRLGTTTLRLAEWTRLRLGDHIGVSRWIRYRIDLVDLPDLPDDVTLAPVDDAVIARLRQHADREENQLVSGFRFWEAGFRQAFIWEGDSGPMCMQWLLTAQDNAALRRLPWWSGMYPPLAEGTGQVENLFTFRDARRRGIATSFEIGMFHQAAALGLRRLFTHVHESNEATHRWAKKTGWTAYGSINKYDCSLGVLGIHRFFVHHADNGFLGT